MSAPGGRLDDTALPLVSRLITSWWDVPGHLDPAQLCRRYHGIRSCSIRRHPWAGICRRPGVSGL